MRLFPCLLYLRYIICLLEPWIGGSGGGGLWAQILSPQKSPGSGALFLGHEARGLASHLCVPTGGAAVLASQMLRPAAPGLGSSHVDSRVFSYLEAARRYYR